MSVAKDVLVAVLPIVAEQAGRGVREALQDRRDRDKPCKHGRPGGRLCAKCHGDDE